MAGVRTISLGVGSLIASLPLFHKEPGATFQGGQREPIGTRFLPGSARGLPAVSTPSPALHERSPPSALLPRRGLVHKGRSNHVLSAGLVRAVTRGAQHDWSLLKRLRPRSSARLVSVDKRGSARRPPARASHTSGVCPKALCCPSWLCRSHAPSARPEAPTDPSHTA